MDKSFIAAIAIAGVLTVGVAVAFTNKDKDNKSSSSEERLSEIYNKIKPSTATPRKANVSFDSVDVADALPDIEKYPLQVVADTEWNVEIFVSPEKAGSGNDSFLIDMAESFNNDTILVEGKEVSVSIRSMASGQGADYIYTGKYVPEAYSPSSSVWGDVLEGYGVTINVAEEKLVGNVAGVVVTKNKAAEYKNSDGSLDTKKFVDGVVNNDIITGYTNPQSSSTGLNFLLSVLNAFDSSNPLGATAIEGFNQFQANIPYVAYTTLQMKESATSGKLEAFVLEYQGYVNSPELLSGYEFIPFGIRHDNPLYSIGNLTSLESGILNEFADYCKRDESQAIATGYGFNGFDNYVSADYGVDSSAVVQAQKLWKDNKDTAAPVIAVFVADNSGSMSGESINGLKKSLVNGAEVINSDTSVGLVTFNESVKIALPIGKFDLNQRSYFQGAIEDMNASGGTAMYDGIVVAAKMLEDAKTENPNANVMMFVLTDGENTDGNDLDDVSDVIKNSGIPIYTIGYNADISVLKNISQINEAASIDADTEDVIYKITALFNAQM